MTLLYDPPELQRYARRGDPPMEHWPGQYVTRQMIMEAYGDPRDWFRYGHRYAAYRRYTAEFIDARRRRRNFTSGVDWNQILIIGDYGHGKSTLAVHYSLPRFRRGHAMFSNAASLVGWRLSDEAMYVAMGWMPTGSTFIIDEASAWLSSRVGHGVAVNTFGQMNLNTRKKLCTVIYMTAHDWEIPAPIRRNCKEVWKPVPKEKLVIEDYRAETGGRPSPANDPNNFRLAYHVWDDFPYRKADLIEGKKEDDGFGPPSYTVYDEGDNVRDAYLLTDTFEPAAAGAATLADRDSIKAQLTAYHEGTGPHNPAFKEISPQEERAGKILAFLADHEYDPPPFFSASDIARETGITSSVVGRVIQEMIPVHPVRNKGYPTDVIYEYLDKMALELEAE